MLNLYTDGSKVSDIATQYVDDKTDLINDIGTGLRKSPHLSNADRRSLFDKATSNANTWAALLWTSGGDLNASKCFYDYLQPKCNFQTQTIAYATSAKTPGTIIVHHPGNDNPHTLTRTEPNIAKRTLGVMLAPDGSTNNQFKTSNERAIMTLNKLMRSRLPNKVKWKAVSTVIEPSIPYPLLACSCSQKEMDIIDKTLSKTKCCALGLNEHFPRVVMYGPWHLGGMVLSSAQSKTTTTRIN